MYKGLKMGMTKLDVKMSYVMVTEILVCKISYTIYICRLLWTICSGGLLLSN